MAPTIQVNFLSVIKSTLAFFRAKPKAYGDLMLVLLFSLLIIIFHGIIGGLTTLLLHIFPLIAGSIKALLSYQNSADYTNSLQTFADYHQVFNLMKAIPGFFINSFPVAMVLACLYSNTYKRNAYGIEHESINRFFFEIYFQALFTCIKHWLIPFLLLIPIAIFMSKIIITIIGLVLSIYALIMTSKDCLGLIPLPYIIYQNGITEKEAREKALEQVPLMIPILMYFYTVAAAGFVSILSFITYITINPWTAIENMEISGTNLWRDITGVLTDPQFFTPLLICFVIGILAYPFLAILPAIFFDLSSRHQFKTNHNIKSLLSCVGLIIIKAAVMTWIVTSLVISIGVSGKKMKAVYPELNKKTNQAP